MKKVSLLYLQTSKEGWLNSIQELYLKKINHFVNFKIEMIKTKSMPRGTQVEKIKLERDLIIKRLPKNCQLVALDEKGKLFKNSREFSGRLQNLTENLSKELVFLIGGSYGLHHEIKAKSELRMSLSPLTMSHHIAQAVMLEQLYRGLTIIQNLPYHND